MQWHGEGDIKCRGLFVFTIVDFPVCLRLFEKCSAVLMTNGMIVPRVPMTFRISHLLPNRICSLEIFLFNNKNWGGDNLKDIKVLFYCQEMPKCTIFSRKYLIIWAGTTLQLLGAIFMYPPDPLHWWTKILFWECFASLKHPREYRSSSFAELPSENGISN